MQYLQYVERRLCGMAPGRMALVMTQEGQRQQSSSPHICKEWNTA